MIEFYVETEGNAKEGPFELDVALSKIPFYVPAAAKRRAMAQYAEGDCYCFNFQYGFNTSKVSVDFYEWGARQQATQTGERTQWLTRAAQPNNEDVLSTFSVITEIFEDEAGGPYKEYTATLQSIELGYTSLPVSMVSSIYGGYAIEDAERYAEEYLK